MPRPEIYVMHDIEANGPIPGPFSMLSFAAVAFKLHDREPLAHFEANLDCLPDAGECPATMAWWQKYPEAYVASRRDTRPPEEVIPEYLEWLGSLPGRPVFVGQPVTYDFQWMNWYCYSFGNIPPGEKPRWGHSGFDVKTATQVLLKSESYHNASKRVIRKRKPHWTEGMPKHDHTALADSTGQGILFVNMMEEALG